MSYLRPGHLVIERKSIPFPYFIKSDISNWPKGRERAGAKKQFWEKEGWGIQKPHPPLLEGGKGGKQEKINLGGAATAGPFF